MIALIIKMIFLITIWVLGVKVITAENMILEKFGRWAEAKARTNKVWDGIAVCEWCMPNIHGLVFVYPLAFLIGVMPFEWSWEYVFMYPFCAFGASFLSGVIWNGFLSMMSCKKMNDNKQEYYYLLNKFNKQKNKRVNNNG